MKLPKRKTQKMCKMLGTLAKHGNPWVDPDHKHAAAVIVREIRRIDKWPKTLFKKVSEIMRKAGITQPYIGKLDKGGARRTNWPENTPIKFWFTLLGCSSVSEKGKAECVSIVGLSDEPDGVIITDWPRRKVQ